MVAALLGLQLTRGYLDPPAPEVAFERPVIAVLPFANLGNDKELEPLADGLTEELISQLGGQFPNRLAVLARTSTVLYKNSLKSAATIAEELGADYLLESSLRGEAGRLRITVQLIDGKDQTHLWAENYDREPEGLLDFQREISSRIAQTLAGRLLPAAVPLAQEPSAEAYLAYLKGVYKLNQQSREAWQEAREYFEEALVQAPDFARAHWGLGRVLAINVRNSEELRRSEEELRLALRLDPSLADAHLSLSRLQLFILRDFRGAKESLQRALELRPDDSETLHQWANWASAHGLHKEALQAVERSRELDPLSASVQADAGLYEYFAGHWQRAVAVSAETLLLEPEHPWARQAMALSLLQENTWTAESWEERFRAPLADMLGVEDGEFTQLVGRYWRQRLEEMKALPDANILKQGEMAVASLALGDTPKALDYLEAAADPGFAWVLIYLRVHPLFEPLRTNPRFEALVNRFSPPREG